MKQPTYNTALYLRLSRDDENAGECTSGSSESKLKHCRIESGEFNPGIFRRKLPVYLGAAVVSLERPRAHLTNKAGGIRERFGKRLSAHDTDLDFCHVKPTSMLRCEMPFKAFR